MEQVTNGQKNEKPLITKSIRPFLIYLIVVLLVSIPVYYIVVSSLWAGEADEYNANIVMKLERNLNQLSLDNEELQRQILTLNRTQPFIKIYPLKVRDQFEKAIYTTYEDRNEETEKTRVLSSQIELNGEPYQIIVKSSMGEADETIGLIAILSFVFLLLLAGGILILTRRLNRVVWRPFHETLQKLRSFHLSKNDEITFSPTDTLEFSQLNESLKHLIEHAVSTFKAQKQFTENASHELQTPLAVLKNKLDILMQDENLTRAQFDIIQDMNKTLVKSSKLNRNLLLLAKVDNRQFSSGEHIDLSEVVRGRVDFWKDYFCEKDMEFHYCLEEGVYLEANRILIELLIDNLMVNALRYTPMGKKIEVVLKLKELLVLNYGESPLEEKKLFKRFSRTSEYKDGNGLGLAIVKAIVDYYGGWDLNYSFRSHTHIFHLKFEQN